MTFPIQTAVVISATKQPGRITGHRATQRGVLNEVEYTNRDNKKSRAEFYADELSALSSPPSAPVPPPSEVSP